MAHRLHSLVHFMAESWVLVTHRVVQDACSRGALEDALEATAVVQDAGVREVEVVAVIYYLTINFALALRHPSPANRRMFMGHGRFFLPIMSESVPVFLGREHFTETPPTCYA